MKKFFYSFTFTLLGLFNVSAQNGCPDCEITLPQLPADTIYLTDLADGEVGIYYDDDLSFRLPKSTTPVNELDPSVPPGINISEITILAAVNLPPGLNWEASQTNFNPSDETDGCVKLCGTPLQPGYYEIEVIAQATILLISQTSAFVVPIYIAPASSNTDGFSMVNNSGCGEVTVSFDNNLASDGNTGYSYFWDFGNGNTSIEENPANQVYTGAGIYEVQYQAVIDTFTAMLTSVTIFSADCDDIIGGADIFIEIKDPSGNKIFETDPINNTPFPVTLSINIPLESGTYILDVKDDDLIGSANCGSLMFNQATIDTLNDGDLEASFAIFKPVFTIESIDTIYVFEQPEAPEISPAGIVELCEGEEIELVASYFENIQWFQDTNILFGEDQVLLIVSEPGNYWAEYTSDDGCKAQSEMVNVTYIDLPELPSFHVTGNELILNDIGVLPADYSIQWYQNSQAIEGANETVFCMTDEGTYNYTLEVTDNATGCSNQFSLGASFNSNFDCTVAVNELTLLEETINIFPNPNRGIFTLSFDTNDVNPVDLSIFDVTGKRIFTENYTSFGNSFKEEIDISNFETGIYLVQLQLENEVIVKRIVKH